MTGGNQAVKRTTTIESRGEEVGQGPQSGAGGLSVPPARDPVLYRAKMGDMEITARVDAAVPDRLILQVGEEADRSLSLLDLEILVRSLDAIWRHLVKTSDDRERYTHRW